RQRLASAPRSRVRRPAPMTPVCIDCGARVAGSALRCAGCLTEVSARYRAIASVTTRYDFAEPLERADLEHVLGELTRALPPGHRPELEATWYEKRRAVGVRVSDPRGHCYYSRIML